MTRQEAMDILSIEIKLATLKGNTRLENALRWAVNDMATSNNWNKICQDLWVENEELEEKLANLEEQKTGKWVDVQIGRYVLLHRCSNCLQNSVMKSKYCSSCGAKMEVEDGKEK